MTAKRRKSQSRVGSRVNNRERRELENRRREIDAALEKSPVDIRRLKVIARQKSGFVDDNFRRRVWPKLVGVNIYTIPHYKEFVEKEHKYSSQIQLDVDRSMCNFDKLVTMDDNERQAKRQVLFNIINAVVSKNKDLHYYQGYHDICTVMMLVVGENRAMPVLERLSMSYHRECMRTDFTAVMEICRMLFPLLRESDPELHNFIANSGVEPFFALPWVITWFAHDLHDYSRVTRLYDLFLTSHPLMSIYVSAAVVMERKKDLLLRECEFSEVHAFLQKLPQDLDMDTVVQRGLELFQQIPPGKLKKISRRRFHWQNYFFAYPYCFSNLQQSPDSELYAMTKSIDKKTQNVSTVQRASSGQACSYCKPFYIAGAISIMLLAASYFVSSQLG